MTIGHVYIACSLDGFVAREDHSLDWLMKQNTDGENHGYEEFVAGMDGLIMGSGSYHQVAAFDPWPYSKPVIVLSNSLTDADIPSRLKDKVTLSRATPGQIMQELDWSHAYIDGGAVIQSFLRAGQIADLHLTFIPILLGQGKRLFGPLPADIDLELISTQKHPSGLVSVKYSVKPSLPES